MSLPVEVMKDLLAVVLAGEASAETRRLVEEYARAHPDFARAVDQAVAARVELEPSAAPDREIETLKRTQRLVLLKSVLMGIAIFLTLLPLSVHSNGKEIRWILGSSAQLASAALAVVFWIWFATVARRLRATGL